MNKKNSNLPSECTTIIVGSRMSADGSRIVARSEDWDAMFAKNLTIYRPGEPGSVDSMRFDAFDSPFACDLPGEAQSYSALPPYHLKGHWGSAGFNESGVGMSATESIFSSDAALAVDPLVEDGVAENSVFNIVLPYIHTAREGVERLGKLIEEYGVSEGFGIGFVDSDEIWYLETASGHRWLACRIPEEQYFVTGNQSRFRQYDPKDKEHFMASSDLIEFAQEHGLYDPKEGAFDFHKAYIRDVELDTTYNYPRVWGLQQMFTPAMKQDVAVNDFPVYAKAEKPITMEAMRHAFRFHYDGTEHDPYLHSNPHEVYRPVSIFRTTQTHILQVQPKLPVAVGRINHVCLGMADLGLFVPLFQGVTSYPEPYTRGGGESSQESAYWTFRKVQVLGMTNYNKYAPLIKSRYHAFEMECDERIEEIQRRYCHMLDKGMTHAAQDMLQEASDTILWHALDVADALIEELFTQMTRDIQAEYLFHGA